MKPSADINVVRGSFSLTALFESNKSSLRLMAKCKKCNKVIENSEHGMLLHWKYFCVSKYQFKYNNVTTIGEVLMVTCLLCNQQFYKTTVANALQMHHDKCKKLQTLASVRPRIQPKIIATGTIANGGNTSMPSCSTNANRFILSTRNQNVGTTARTGTVVTPVVTQVHKVVITAPVVNAATIVTITPKNAKANKVTFSLDEYQYNLRIVKRLHDNKDLKCAQCRICKKYIGMELVLHHRKQCKIIEDGQQMVENRQQSPEPVEQEPEILISTQTVHTENATVQKDTASTPDGSTVTHDPTSSCSSDAVANVTKPTNSKSKTAPKCFVCNSAKGDSFLNLYGTVSAYTASSIYDFIWKWLGGKPSVRNERTDASELTDELICSDCLDTINDYDAALATAKQCKKQICGKLMKTEAHFQRMQNEENINVTNGTINGGVSVDDVQHYPIIMEETATESETDAHANVSRTPQTGTKRARLAQRSDIIDLCDDD